MRFGSVLVSFFLFASAVLASPFQSQQLDLLERSSPTPTGVNASQKFGGGILERNNGSFNYVHGSFAVPEVSSPAASESFATVAIVIDGASCPGGVYFQVGVNFHARSNGTTEIQAQYQWGPDSAGNLNISIAVGDYIQLTLIVFNETTGHAFISILNSTVSDDSPVQSSHPLCGQSAAWVVKGDQGNQTALADFGAVTFTGAAAGQRGQHLLGPDGATIMELCAPKAKTGTIVYDDNSLSILYLQGQ